MGLGFVRGHAGIAHRAGADVRFAEEEGVFVDSGMVFVGVFSVKDKPSAGGMPVQNESGFWQAWEMPDGFFMVQPLNEDRTPWGAMHLLAPQAFSAMLSLVSSPGSAAGEAAKSGHGDMPDLLSLWYAQALAEQGATVNEEPVSRAPLPKRPDGDPWADKFAATPTKARMSPDEATLVPSWHPDDLFADDNDSTRATQAERLRPGKAAVFPESAARDPRTHAARPSQAGAFAPSAKSLVEQAGETFTVVLPEAFAGCDELLPDVFVGEPLVSGNPLDFMPALSLDGEAQPITPTSPAAARADAGAPHDEEQPLLEFRDDDAYAEIRSQRLEQQMREEFAVLMEQLDQGTNPAVEKELARLLQRGTGFSWKQKFMFTEFGCMLRRKRLQTLALASHMRALGFAPRDEHVLFNVARSAYELGKTDAAKLYLNRALEAAPDFEAAKRFLSFLGG